MQLHVFGGSFRDLDAARLYTEPQWEPEPDDSVSDDEYSAWEDRNPIWELRSELGCYLNSDFIETIFGDRRLEYLSSLLKDKQDVEQIQSQLDTSTNVLVLLFPGTLGGFPATMKSTSRLRYCGEFDFGWPAPGDSDA